MSPLASLRRLLQTALALVQTRFELLAVELQQEELRVFDALVLAVLGCVLLGIGAVLLALLVAVLFWEEHRLLALSVLTVLFVAIGGGVLMLARNRLQRGVPFAASLAELNADRNVLASKDAAP